MGVIKKRALSESTTYQGLFIRDYIGEKPDQAGTGGWTNSPDIICNGTAPIADPTTITSTSNYDAGLPAGNSEVPEKVNFVYVRGKNESAPETTSTIYFYYAQQSLSLLPSGWLSAAVEWNGKKTNGATVQVDSDGDIVVTTPSFLWTPPKKGEHYCLVAWARNGADQSTPPTLPTINDWGALGEFILKHPQVAWRNMQELAATKNVYEKTVAIDNPPKGGDISVGLSFDKVPGGGTWEMTVPMEKGAAFHKTGTVNPRSDQPYFVAYPVDLPKDWKTTLTFKYTPPSGKKVPKDATIEPLVINGIGGDMVERVRALAPQRLVRWAAADHGETGDKIQYGMVLGSVLYKLEA